MVNNVNTLDDETKDVSDDLEQLGDNLVLTTVNNPFNPKTHYDNWKAWDEGAGYYTEAYVARVADVPIDADIEDDILMEQFIQQAHHSILENDETGLYMLV